MADLEFFLDPVCPWAWITSRWITEVKQLRTYEVNWRFICLKMINEHRTDDWYTPEYRAGHMAGLYGLRVADQVRIELGNDQVGALYTAMGEFIHGGGRRLEITADPVAGRLWVAYTPSQATSANSRPVEAASRSRSVPSAVVGSCTVSFITGRRTAPRSSAGRAVTAAPG